VDAGGPLGGQPVQVRGVCFGQLRAALGRAEAAEAVQDHQDDLGLGFAHQGGDELDHSSTIEFEC
jgi:hypothetical protein